MLQSCRDSLCAGFPGEALEVCIQNYCEVFEDACCFILLYFISILFHFFYVVLFYFCKKVCSEAMPIYTHVRTTAFGSVLEKKERKKRLPYSCMLMLEEEQAL